MTETLPVSLMNGAWYRTVFATRDKARIEIFDWIQWRRRKRQHSSFGDISPNEFPQVSYVESCVVKHSFGSHLVSNSYTPFEDLSLIINSNGGQSEMSSKLPFPKALLL
jgi:hypothetical protein